jgi:hypothetical protein
LYFFCFFAIITDKKNIIPLYIFYR